MQAPYLSLNNLFPKPGNPVFPAPPVRFSQRLDPAFVRSCSGTVKGAAPSASGHPSAVNKLNHRIAIGRFIQGKQMKGHLGQFPTFSSGFGSFHYTHPSISLSLIISSQFSYSIRVSCVLLSVFRCLETGNEAPQTGCSLMPFRKGLKSICLNKGMPFPAGQALGDNNSSIS